MDIGKLKKVELRQVWSREDMDFTNWLNDNLDILGEAIGLDLEESETECLLDNSDFRVDIRVTTKEGAKIVIENQLEKTDHKHLGQIMTYMVNMEAESAVWIAKKVREEHTKVINWLNESIDKDFYLIQLESYQIDDSKPAPFLKVICRPSMEIKRIGQQKRESNEVELHRKQLKTDFWEGFFEKAKSKTDFFLNDKPHWWTGTHTEIGKTGLELGCRINKDKTAVLIKLNPDLKDKFLHLKENLESKTGFLLEQPDKVRMGGFPKSNKVEFIKWFDKGGYKNPKDQWNQIQEELLDHFVKLEKALKPLLKELKAANKAA